MAAAAALALGAPAAAAPRADDMVLGRANAPVEIIEYASLTCSHCARFHADVFPAFKKKYVDTGKVRFILRELPTAPVEVAVAGFLLGRCAGRDKYFKVIDDIFKSQGTWYGTGAGPRAALLGVAKANGLTEAQFEACVTDAKAVDAMRARVGDAIDNAKVGATPTFFVNGKLAKAGEMSLAELDAAIAAASASGGR